MRRTTMTGLVLMALAVSAAGVACPARADAVYTLKDLGSVIANAVNDSGQVAGAGGTAGGAGHAFLSGPGGGALQDLGTLPGGTFSEGLGVNASGQVTGVANPTAISSNHAPSP